jgi:hypothetical protein
MPNLNVFYTLQIWLSGVNFLGLMPRTGEAIRNVYYFRSHAASRTRSWRWLWRGSRRPAAWLTAIRRFG